VGEDEGALLACPVLNLPLKFYGREVLAERGQQGRAGLHPPVLAVLAELDPATFLAVRSLNVNASSCPVDVLAIERR